MLESPEGDQAWVPRQHPDQFRIARTPNVAPYGQKPIKGKNKEWDTLNKNIKKLLDEIFKPGHDVRLFNPLYPNNRSKDMIFQITTYRWKTRPHSSKLGNYKFQVLTTPGHSPGHTSFYEISHKSLLSGDLIGEVGTAWYSPSSG